MPTSTQSLFKSSSKLSLDARSKVTEALNASLADGLDLYSQIKVAHWNLKGPYFAALHPQFDSIASAALENNDEIAERAVALGALATGTVRTSASRSRLAQYPEDLTRDLDHVRQVVERIETYLEGLRKARSVGEGIGDTDTVDLLTGMITAFEKHGWFLRATLES
jgi:starvation-inducible DNA-binding protein